VAATTPEPKTAAVAQARVVLTFENSDLAEHHQLDILVVLGSLEGLQKTEVPQESDAAEGERVKATADDV
jgi:hypothetical protein